MPVEVKAVAIKAVGNLRPDGSRLLMLEDGEDSCALASGAMLARFTPAPGDYFVRQEDGYTYLNPKAVFERKYKEL